MIQPNIVKNRLKWDRIVYGSSPQTFRLGGPVEQGERGTGPHEQRAGTNTQFNLHKLSCPCVCAPVCCSCKSSFVHTCWFTIHMARLPIGHSQIVGHGPGVVNPWSMVQHVLWKTQPQIRPSIKPHYFPALFVWGPGKKNTALLFSIRQKILKYTLLDHFLFIN